MSTLNKQSCPTCGQSVNVLEIPLNQDLVRCLLAVYQYCKTTGKHEFKRKDIDHLIPKGHAYGNFGYLKNFFAGMVYSPENPTGHGKGWWGFNLSRLEEFFSNRRTAYTIIHKDRLASEGEQIKLLEPKLLKEIPQLSQFLDENKDFISQYIGYVEFGADGQGKLI